MDGLTPHIEYRVGNLHREAEARRLAGSATGASHAPVPPGRDRRRLAAAAGAMALAFGLSSSGLYLVVASGTDPNGPDVAAVVVQTAAPPPDMADDRVVVRLPQSGGIRMHR
jgi:hypothetical protein